MKTCVPPPALAAVPERLAQLVAPYIRDAGEDPG